MAPLSPNEYQVRALLSESTPSFVAPEFEGGYVSMARLLHGALGACTEVGELQDAIKKHLMYGREFDRVNVIEECGDILWYMALCLSAVGSNMDEAMERNLAKLFKRYGNRFTAEAALNRDLEGERKLLEEVK
jgi:NTP pyrophosphatase (non-canonical NTP hydrolase)